jgi:hypothetical protein
MLSRRDGWWRRARCVSARELRNIARNAAITPRVGFVRDTDTAAAVFKRHLMQSDQNRCSPHRFDDMLGFFDDIRRLAGSCN